MATCPHCGGDVDTDPPRSVNQRKCPSCGAHQIVELPSVNKNVCFNCHAEFDWKLKPNQKSVLIEGLIGEDK